MADTERRSTDVHSHESKLYDLLNRLMDNWERDRNEVLNTLHNLDKGQIEINGKIMLTMSEGQSLQVRITEAEKRMNGLERSVFVAIGGVTVIAFLVRLVWH